MTYFRYGAWLMFFAIMAKERYGVWGSSVGPGCALDPALVGRLPFLSVGGGVDGTVGRCSERTGCSRPVKRGHQVAAERLERILAELSGDVGKGPRRACARPAAALVGISGAGIMLMSGDVPAGSLATTNEVSALIEELQYAFGEGPCVDAYHQDRVVHEANLADPATGRWLAFTPPALAAGVRAVFGFPLRVGGVRLGALNLYRDRPGPLSMEQHADALAMADVVARWVLAVQADAPTDTLADQLEFSADFHYVVQNAAGMVSVQLGVTVSEALIRIRALAFTRNAPSAT